MTKKIFQLSLVLLFTYRHFQVEAKLLHSYYSLEVAEDISDSKSIVELTKCKDECLQMKDYFPFKFRYHRLIIRQSDGMVKYFTGTCQVKMLTDDYESWSNLKKYIDATSIFGDSDVKNKEQLDVWQSYYNTCQDPKLKLNETEIQSLQLNRDHSNFIYYDDGSFENLQPFNDIGSMFQNLSAMTG